MTPHPEYGRITVDDRSCFLCGITTESITGEHVFPKWLQSRYNLWNARMDLLNLTSIAYRQLKIPCCATCNSGPLSQLEDAISNAVTGGYRSAADLDPRKWYLWAAKIYFGLLRKELTLGRDRRNPTAGAIVLEDGLRSFSSLHLFLQGIRGKHEFVDVLPYSVLVCNLHDLGKPRDYSFRDNLFHMTVAIRMNDVGIVVCLEDRGLTDDSYGRYIREVNHRKLHPIQFDELFARSTYQVSLIEGPPKYLTEYDVAGDRSAKTTVFGNVRLRNRSNEELSEVLRANLSQWVKKPKDSEVEWFIPPDLVPTWMTRGGSDPLLQSLKKWEAETRLDS